MEQVSASSSSSSLMERSDHWLYFVAGALLPTLAYALLLRDSRQTKTLNKAGGSKRKVKTVDADEHEEEGEDEDDDDEDDDDDDEEDDEDEMNLATTGGPSAQWGYAHAPYKMVFCVNMSLKAMGKGKMAAQCCHAAVGCYKRALKQCPTALKVWEYTGCAKICVKCPEEEEMLRIAAVAMSLDIPIYLVQDAGRTQIAAGSRTVLGLFGPVGVLEGVTDHLKLM